MPRDLKQIAFILQEFGVPSPAQQLLDRFLLGYPRGGRFYQPEDCQVTAYLAPGASDVELKRRVKDFGLKVAASVEDAVAKADATIVVWRGAGAAADDRTLRLVLENAPTGTGCFVRGNLAIGTDAARNIMALAGSRKIALLAGGSLGVTWRLPEIATPNQTVLKEALIVVQGAAPEAEFEGLDGLFPFIEGRRGGETGVRRMRCLAGADVWQAGKEREWSWPLLAAAISRSDSPQGDPEKDGRTQDLAGLGLVPKLARSPRAWLLEHNDGLRSAILVLDGVVADANVAFRNDKGDVVSVQLYRPPPPGQHEFSRLAERVEAFFRSGQAPWPVARGALVAGLLEVRAQALKAPAKWVKSWNLTARF